MGQYMNQQQLEKIQAKEALERKLWTPEKFLMSVEKYAQEYDYDMVDAVVEYCKLRELEIDFVAKELMSPRLYSRIQEDAENKRLIKKVHQLHFQ